MSNLRIGIPSKGRLAEVAGELLKEAGLSFRRQERSLFARCREMPVDVTFLRTEDIPVLCAEGAIDMGITGGDLVAESGVDVDLAARPGRGRMPAGGLRARGQQDRVARPSSTARRVATSFPHVTEQLSGRAQGARPIWCNLSGSVEIMIALGVADAIVDLVETGSTLAANRLRILDEIGRYQTVLVQNTAVPAGRTGRPRRAPAGRRGHRPQLFAAGVQRAAGQAGRGRKDHAGLQLADGQRAGRRRLVRRAGDGARGPK